MTRVGRPSAIALALVACVALAAGSAEARKKKAHKHKTPAAKPAANELSPDLAPDDRTPPPVGHDEEAASPPETTPPRLDDKPKEDKAKANKAKDEPEAEGKLAAPAPAVTVDEDASPAAKPSEAAPPAIALERKQEAGAPPRATSSSHAWLWATLGVLVAAGAVGAYLAFRPHDPVAPNTELGNYRF
jgi:hypothetical protein